MKSGREKRPAAGFTLVELVVAIIVLGIALSGILLVMNYTTSRSADPMIQHQGVAIAESYLEEVLLKAFNEDAVPGTTDTEGAWGFEADETDRTLYDDVNDYHGLAETPHDQEGGAIAALSAYSVAVQVQNTTLNGVAAARALVTVSLPDGSAITLSGYRTSY